MAQKLATFALILLLGSLTANAANTTRYWDSCKPSCAWTGNAGGSPNGVATSCNVNGVKLSNSADAANACQQNGPSYTCMGQVPWRVSDNESYGFAASHSNGDCGKCFKLTFTSDGEGGTVGGSIINKTMTVMVSNIGGDVGGDQFDLMIPGGGVGIYNALTTQISQNGGPSNPSLGNQYGGFRAQCGANATCIKNMCDAAFNSAGLADLKAGCYWFIDWFKVANNPIATKQEVSCPAALIDAYKNGKGGGGGSSSNSTGSSSSSAPPATYTLTVNRNPTGGGTTTPSPSQSNITAGQQVNIAATPGSNYIFQNWTAASGSPTFENNLSATTKVTVYQNTTITANFSTKPTQTWTLTASAYPSGGGTVSPTSQTGTTINISATANTGYTFQGWVVVSGTATFGNASSATTTVTLSANATIRANFTSNSSSSGGGNQSSSSMAVGAGNCITPPGSVAPPNGIETCIIVSGKCYICNPERGQQCSSETWLWNGSQVNDVYWFTQVSCPSDGSSSSKASSSSAGSINWSGAGVLKIEAEDYVSKVGSNMQTITNGDITNIGYIESGYSTTYKVNMTAAGTFPAGFSIATGVSSNFTVWVNNAQIGTISKSGSDWSAYSTVNLSSNVSLSQGENTIELRFQSAVNVDYFQLTGTPVSSSSSGTVPVLPQAVVYSNGAHIQANGIYLQVVSNAKLELFDLRGNSVKKMNFSSGVYSVQLNDLPKGLYLAKVSFGSERKILRVPLR